MVKKISRSKARTRKMIMRSILRWALYAAVLLMFYLWETNPLIKGFCPLLMIPLACAVALHEGELAAGVFGAVCGLMLDLASGTIFGFSALWLLACCPFISLLSQFWIKVNLVSHFLLNAAVCTVVGFLDFLFLHWVWEQGESTISLVNSVLPAYGGAILLSVPVYLAVRSINAKMRPKQQRMLDEAAQTAEETSSKARD